MKFWFFIIIVLTTNLSFAYNLDSLNQYTGWENVGSYQQQKLQIGKITYSKLIEKDSKLFTCDNNKYFRIWDLKTGKIEWMMEEEPMVASILLGDTIILFVQQSKSNVNEYSVYHFNLITQSKKLIPGIIKSNDSSGGTVDFNHLNLIKNGKIGVNYSFYFGILEGNSYGTKFYNYDDFSTAKKIADRSDFEWSQNSNFNSSVIKTWGTFKNSYWSHSTIIFCKDTVIIKSFNTDNYNPSQHSLNREGNKQIFNLGNKKLMVFDYLKNTQEITTLPIELTSIISTGNNSILSVSQSNLELICYNYLNNTFNKIDLKNEHLDSKYLSSQNDSTLIVTTTNGLISSFDISKFNLIKADFDIDSNSILVGQTLKFNNFSSSSSTEFSWDFGDGTTSSEINPRKSYKEAGKYTIKLIAGDGIKYDTVVKVNCINVSKYYYPIISSETYCAKVPIKLTLSNANAFKSDSIFWEIGNNNLIPGEKIEYLFKDTGKVLVKLHCYVDGTKFTSQKTFVFYNSNLSNLFIKNFMRGRGSHTSYNNGKTQVITSFDLKNVILKPDNQIAYNITSNYSQEETYGNSYSTVSYYTVINDDYDESKKLKASNVLINKNTEIYPGFNDGVLMRNPENPFEVVLFDNKGNEFGIYPFPNYDKIFVVNNEYIYGINGYYIDVYDKLFSKIDQLNLNNLVNISENEGFKLLNTPKMNHYYRNFLLPFQNGNDLFFVRFTPDGKFVDYFTKKNFKANSVAEENNNLFFCIEEETYSLYVFDAELKELYKNSSNYQYSKYIKNGYFINFETKSTPNENWARTVDISIKDYKNNFLEKHTILLEDTLNLSILKSLVSWDNHIYIYGTFFGGYGDNNSYSVYKLSFLNNEFCENKSIDDFPQDIENTPQDTNQINQNSYFSYPNPSSDFVRINLDTNNFNSVKCYDAIGVEYSINLRQIDSKTYEVDLRALPKGIFTLKIVYPDKAFPVRFIKE